MEFLNDESQNSKSEIVPQWAGRLGLSAGNLTTHSSALVRETHLWMSTDTSTKSAPTARGGRQERGGEALVRNACIVSTAEGLVLVCNGQGLQEGVATLNFHKVKPTVVRDLRECSAINIRGKWTPAAALRRVRSALVNPCLFARFRKQRRKPFAEEPASRRKQQAPHTGGQKVHCKLQGMACCFKGL